MLYFIALQIHRIGSQALGIIIPLILLLLLFPITWWLYKHFSGPAHDQAAAVPKRGRGRPPKKAGKSGFAKRLSNYFWGDLT